MPIAERRRGAPGLRATVPPVRSAGPLWRRWEIVAAVVLLAAAILRFASLDLKPLHHDEGVNGYFLLRLLRNGFYHYDPSNYHGPTLYYFAAITSGLNVFLFGTAGLDATAIRMVPALFGLATVWLILDLRKRIGTVAAAAAAALLALSPGPVFLSRYFIHETPFVFFTLAAVVSGLRYYETRRPRYLMLTSVSAALLFATKETAIVSVAVILAAALGAEAYIRLRGGAAQFRLTWGIHPRNLRVWLGAVSLFLLVAGLFYSSFLTNFQGIYDAVSTFRIWGATARTENTHAWYTYVQWLAASEPLLVILGVAGTMLAFWRKPRRFGVFAAFWWVGLLAAYSILPYKTPWLALNFLVPLAISAGIGVQEFHRWCRDRFAASRANSILAALALTLVIPCVQSVRFNFYRYDDPTYPYVYAQTERGFLGLVDEVKAIARSQGTDRNTTIAVVSRDYWPLPWYLQQYTNVGYHGKIVPTDAPIVISSAAQEPELGSQFLEQYERVGMYPLRPGLQLVLFVRKGRS